MYRIGLSALILSLCLAGCGIAGSGNPQDGDIAKIDGTEQTLRQVVADCDPKEFYDLLSPVERAQRTPTPADLALAKKQLCPDEQHRETQIEALRVAWKGSIDWNGDANATISSCSRRVTTTTGAVPRRRSTLTLSVRAPVLARVERSPVGSFSV